MAEREASGGGGRRRRRGSNRQAVSPEQVARWLHESVLASKRGIEDSAIYLSSQLSAMEHGRVYEALGFASFEDYLAAPDLRLTPAVADRLRPLRTQLGEPLVPGGGRPAAPEAGLLTELLQSSQPAHPASARAVTLGGAATGESTATPSHGMDALEALAAAAASQGNRLAVVVVPSTPWRIEAILANGRSITGEDLASVLAQLLPTGSTPAEETGR